ncbi:hypothetical protein [Streptomyces sp. XD-27]|uniref:hypothetical protein n=1 Tax=Streptomyces sp. XD-27 TaxID=3062779 RepID=UPI0026F4229A|nr:hypothetical protein [Streptomyces sp. XD-27]WKX71908.1 hypothetical protein Q3Y56_20190 [Streptomyces sp. XD-27]
MQIRRALAAAVLVSAAFTLTACQDDGGTETDASATASSKPKPHGDPATPDGGGDCHKVAPGNKVIWVNNVEGAMNNVIAKEAKDACTATSPGGSAYHPVGELKTFALSPDAKVTVNEPNYTDKKGPHSGLAHVKLCADPNGENYDGGQAKTPEGLSCTGNFYEVALDGNTITKMTELYSS